MATVGQVAVIVAQGGMEAAAPLEALAATADVASNVIVLSQEPGETISQLGQRVRARVALLLKEGFRVQSATFVAKSGFNLADVLPTAEMLRILVATMVAVGHGRVYLHAHPRDTRAHYALASLAAAISDQVRGTGVEIIHGPPRTTTVQQPAARAPMAAAVL